MALVHALPKVSIELILFYFQSFEIFIIQIGEMAFYKPNFMIIKSNYFQSVQKGEYFLNDFESLVSKIDVLPLVLQNGLRPHSSAISRTTMRSRNVILKVVTIANNPGFSPTHFSHLEPSRMPNRINDSSFFAM
jgi:hypothetical protein